MSLHVDLRAARKREAYTRLFYGPASARSLRYAYSYLLLHSPSCTYTCTHFYTYFYIYFYFYFYCFYCFYLQLLLAAEFVRKGGALCQRC